MNVALFSTHTAISPGQIRGAPAGSPAYVSLYGAPILVTDIVFDWDWTIPARAAAQAYGTPLGDAIRARIRYRNQPITNGFVPVNLICSATNWQRNAPALLAPAQVIHTSFTWTLPSPLWLPPNVPLSIEIQHQNDFSVASAAAATDVDVTVRGVLDESGVIPDAVDVPYVTAFLGAVQTTSTGGKTGLLPVVTEQSGATDLFNPFEVPLSVERLLYEISVSSHGYDTNTATNANFAPTDATSGQDQTGRILAGANYGLDRRYFTMKLASSKGRSLVKDYVPVGSIASANTRSLDMHSVLSPGAYFAATLREQMPLFTDRGTVAFQSRVGLSIVGTRRLTPGEALATY